MSAGLVFDALLSLPFCFRNPQRYFSIWGQIFSEFAFEFLRPIWMRNEGLCTIVTHTHFLYGILDSKKTSRFQFSVPGLREIHRNLKQQKNFNSHDGFFRKSPFCTFSSINPVFIIVRIEIFLLF